MKNKFTNIFLFLIFTIVLSSCVTQNSIPDPNFLGDYDPVLLGDVSVYTTNFGSEKANKIEIYFAPRTNMLHLHIKDSINKMNIKLSEANRTFLQEAIISFSDDLNNDRLQNRKPTSKNAYGSSIFSMEWGITGAGHETDEAGILYNYKYLSDGRPYFMIDLKQGADLIMEGAKSPTADIYISPSNLEDLLKMTKQDFLLAVVEELNSNFAY